MAPSLGVSATDLAHLKESGIEVSADTPAPADDLDLSDTMLERPAERKLTRRISTSTATLPSSDGSLNPMEIPTLSQCRWDFFLSHKQSNAQDAVQNLRFALLGSWHAATFWLDLEQDPTVHAMRHGVCFSRNFLLFLTRGVTQSRYCQLEMRWALQANKNIILVAETDERHGKADINELVEQCPEDLRCIFQDNVIIPWFRDPEIKAVCVAKILRKCVREEEENGNGTDSLQPAKSKPLVFRPEERLPDNHVQVIDSSFKYFTGVFGLPLPGASRTIKRWGRAVQLQLFVCGCLCFSRFFYAEGPAFLDKTTNFQIFTVHFYLFALSFVVLSMLSSDLVRELLEKHIDCGPQAERLRLKTRVLCVLVWILTLTVSGVGYWGWLPGFLHPYYMQSLGNERPDHFFLFGVVHSLAWFIVLPVFFGFYFSSLLMLFILQELCYMAFLTCLSRLSPDISPASIESISASSSPISVEERDLTRFKVSFLKVWKLQHQLHQRLSLPYMVFWACQLVAIPWSIMSLLQGLEPDMSDPRLEIVRKYEYLLVRNLWNVVFSPWFGLGGWILALYPWCGIIYDWNFFGITKDLVFVNSNHEAAFNGFLSKFRIYVSAYGLHATPHMLLLHVPILLLNTASQWADRLRLLNGLAALE